MPRLLLLALVPLAFAACKDAPSTRLSARTPTASDSTLTLTGITYNHRTGVVEGRVENRTASPYDSLGVWLTLRTFGGDSLAALTLDTLRLGAGETWAFSRTPAVPARDSVAYVRVVRYAGTRRADGERTDATLNRDVPAPQLSFGR